MTKYKRIYEEYKPVIDFLVYAAIYVGLCSLIALFRDQILFGLKFAFGVVATLLTSLWGLIVAVPVGVWLLLLILK